MKIGRLRHKVPIYRVTYTQDEFNDLVPTKELVGTFSSRVEYTQNDTGDTNGLNQNFKDITIHTRYSRNAGRLDNNMVAEFDGKEWNITGVINREFKNRELMIYCTLRGD